MTSWWFIDDLRRFLLIWFGVSVGLNALLIVLSDSAGKRVLALLCAIMALWIFWMIWHSTVAPA